MKKTICLFAAAMFGSFLLTSGLTSCDTAKENNDLQATVSQSNAEQEIVTEEDFEKVFHVSLQMVNEDSHLSIKAVEGGYIFEILSGGWTPTPEKVLCRWDGAPAGETTFLKCCTGVVKQHHCIRLGYSNGQHTAVPVTE